MKPCRHEPPRPAECRLCYLYETDPAYRALWDAAPPPGPVEVGRVLLPCVHLGRVLDRRDCNCPLEHVRRCEVLGRCTLRLCLTCPHYEADQ